MQLLVLWATEVSAVLGNNIGQYRVYQTTQEHSA
jgi:hypothetical protein